MLRAKATKNNNKKTPIVVMEMQAKAAGSYLRKLQQHINSTTRILKKIIMVEYKTTKKKRKKVRGEMTEMIAGCSREEMTKSLIVMSTMDIRSLRVKTKGATKYKNNNQIKKK